MRSPPSVATGLFAGRYAIEREIGQGASAIVYLARDTQSGTAVALKILRPELAESRASDRFLREIKRTSALQHPHILPVLDAGDHDGQLYFALPYMEGGTLRQLLKREKHLELSQVIAISKTIAEALDYAHERGLIHRDVKPENILFTNGVACLGDFGIARAIDLSGSGGTGTTSRNVVRGTAAYMSPEQAAGSQDLDGRSDVFSLSCVIYEMITGMQAYIGPTDEAVIAQRFIHPPRDLSVYRSTVPTSLNAALQRAFAITPADRYRKAADLIASLENAVDTEIDGGISDGAARRLKSRKVLLVLAGVFVIAMAMIPASRRWIDRNDISLDTTRVVVLPIEGGSDRVGDALLRQSLMRWLSLDVVDQFQVVDAVRRYGNVEGIDDAARIAASLGAGRFIRAAATPFGGAWQVSASLYDTRTEDVLYRHTVAVPRDDQRAAAAYAALADALLLRGVPADSQPVSGIGSRSLPAVQAFGAALAALDQWDLAAADSALQDAIAYDPYYGRANLWLAQIRSWQSRPATSWAALATRAATAVDQLSERERKLAGALVNLSSASYSLACAQYDELVRRNSRDFAAWFGLGQCQVMNNIVEPDPRSPSGWRFRMDIDRAMSAFENAFRVLPSVHRDYERGAFDGIRQLLLVSEQMMPGYTATDSATFWGRLGIIRDSLVLVPYPWQTIARGDGSSVPPGHTRAVERQRQAFRRIAAGWSAAYPRSPGAKHAVALALELLRDPGAIDTIRAARRLVRNDDSRRVQLAAAEVFLLTKFGIPDRAVFLESARGLADSLLAPMSSPAEHAATLVPVAALMGRCERAADLSRQMVSTGSSEVPHRLKVDAQIHFVYLALGCPVTSGAQTLSEFADLIAREFPDLQRRRLIDGRLLYRPSVLALDARLLERVHQATGTRLVAAALAAATGNELEARKRLEASDDAARGVRLTPDIGFAKARLWLTLGDTARAIAILDQMLVSDLRYLEPAAYGQDAGIAACILMSIALRADLADATADSEARRRWGAIANALLASSETALRPVAQRMHRFAKDQS